MTTNYLDKIFRIPSKIRDFSLGALGIICVLLGILSTMSDKLAAGGIFFTAGILLCMFSGLSRFESIKGLGVEAKMAVLNEKLVEAEQLMAHMRKVVGLMADISFQAMGRIGRIDDDVPKSEALAIADNFRTQLSALGESPAEINKRMAPWHESNIRDLAQPIFDGIQTFIQYQNQALTQEERNLSTDTPAGDPRRIRVAGFFDRNSAFQRRLNDLWVQDVQQFSDKVTDLVLNSSTGTEVELKFLMRQLQPSLDELCHYVSHNEFKDRDAWLQRPYRMEIPLSFQ